MNKLGFRLGGAAIGVLIGLALTALADLSLDLIGDLSGLAIRRGLENLVPTSLSDQYVFALVVAFFSALGGILVAENAN